MKTCFYVKNSEPYIQLVIHDQVWVSSFLKSISI